VCTLTWIALDGGYELNFNRDEKLTRATALPPRRFESGGRVWLAPTDPDGGGAWIGVNDRGLTVALLNGYRRADQDEREWRSRGLLTQDLLQLDSLAEFEPRLRAQRLDDVRSFTVVMVGADAKAQAATWDGAELSFEAREFGWPPYCSSSLDPTGATRARRALFDAMTRERGGVDRGLLAEFHASHAPERGPLSPCMHRADARTQSFTRILVGRERVEISYTPDSPCSSAPAVTLSAARRRDAAAR